MSKPSVPAPDQTNNQDRLFAQLATAGGLAETEFGKMAAGKAKTDVVRQFASMTIRDHDDANAKLKTLVDDARIPVPTALDPDHQAVRDQLAKLSGAAFDEAYIKAQIVEHQKTAQLLAWEISMGEDVKLQQFAAAMLPIVVDHLQWAQHINASLTGSAVRTPVTDSGGQRKQTIDPQDQGIASWRNPCLGFMFRRSAQAAPNLLVMTSTMSTPPRLKQGLSSPRWPPEVCHRRRSRFRSSCSTNTIDQSSKSGRSSKRSPNSTLARITAIIKPSV
ncbi:DUF4142 domain-containing protein [Rhizobium sp. RCC_161_2]|uniref:DUF4142 domain-containing protein n=1 Tax=Rhizobium sp. RCC_161_2 TaxID=3239219 RepID=UPI0035244152